LFASHVAYGSSGQRTKHQIFTPSIAFCLPLPTSRPACRKLAGVSPSSVMSAKGARMTMLTTRSTDLPNPPCRPRSRRTLREASAKERPQGEADEMNKGTING
jgi:hypothetical protein